MGDELVDQALRALRRREVAGEAVAVVDAGERLEEDRGDLVNVGGLGRAQPERDGVGKPGAGSVAVSDIVGPFRGRRPGGRGGCHPDGRGPR